MVLQMRLNRISCIRFFMWYSELKILQVRFQYSWQLFIGKSKLILWMRPWCHTLSNTCDTSRNTEGQHFFLFRWFFYYSCLPMNLVRYFIKSSFSNSLEIAGNNYISLYLRSYLLSWLIWFFLSWWYVMSCSKCKCVEAKNRRCIYFFVNIALN